MSDIAMPATAGLLLLSQFLSALAAQSLREFSYSKLDEICKSRGKEGRFSEILKQYENALLAAESLLLTATIALVAVIADGLRLWWPTESTALGWTALLIQWAGLALVLLFMGVVLPWSVARVASDRYLFRIWPTLLLLIAAGRPFLAVARRIDLWMHRLTGQTPPDRQDEAAAITEEIRTVVDEGHMEGVLESGARRMIHRVMELQDEEVAAVMTPRTDMVTLPAESSLEDARQTFLDCGHSRIPLIGESIDEVLGILYAKDLLRHIGLQNGEMPQLRDIVREPFYVPETTAIDTLLETFKRDRVHFAVVVDEYGGVAGLVTLEDILEQIVGDIVDEYDPAEEQGIRPLGPGVTEVDAWVHIDELNEQFGFTLPDEEDFDTIGGFVFSQLGRIPKPGETITWQNLKLTVLEADKRKLKKLRLEVDETLAATAREEG